MSKRKKIIFIIVIIVCIFIGIGSSISIQWLFDNFGNLTMDELIFHIKVPLEGTSTDMIWKYLRESVWKILILTTLISAILIYPILKDIKSIKNAKTSKKKRTPVISLAISIVVLIANITSIVEKTDLDVYIANQINDSKFIEQEYVAPEETKIEFPEEKRNLIYIFLESMETTYYTREDGGISYDNLIPEISKLAKENTDFSTTGKLGGAHVLGGTGWTVGAMSAQTAGVPLKLSIEANSLGEYSVFLGGAYSIGQVLEENGYHNFLLLGSDATFGGRRSLFTQHGNYEIWDFVSAQEENKVKEKVWWGYTDDKLFEYAKEKVTDLSKKDKPFNFTMLTADTHFQDGYECKDCKKQWDEQYKDVISCSSRRVGEFIEWAKKQEFYEDTTIVIVGDHLTMQKDFYNNKGSKYVKKVVCTIINPAVKGEEKNREYSTFDLYPTTLAAMGVKIEGDKLALGTNLFSEEQTLVEKYGVEYVNQELSKTSKFYDNNILVSK